MCHTIEAGSRDSECSKEEGKRPFLDPSNLPRCVAEDELESLDQEEGRAFQTEGTARAKAGRHEAM